jgi:hypothetical protein
MNKHMASSLEIRDRKLRQSLEAMFIDGVFRNTIVVVMGDHGNNPGSTISSFLKPIEDRMPFVALFLPKSFRDQFPRQFENLRVNRYRLTRWKLILQVTFCA